MDGHDSEDPKQSTADMTVFGLIDFFASLICRCKIFFNRCSPVVLAKLLYLCCLCIFLKIDDSLNVKPVVTLEDPVLFVLTNSSYT
ncbi:hypothetical protein WN943_017145 [Citrus x changshan-huyou]